MTSAARAGGGSLPSERHGFVGASWVDDLLDQVARAARAAMPVLVVGETGTGKELVALALHRLSGRPGAFVPLNVAALSTQLVETELFGTRRGAFTGAVDRPGLVEEADRGTLFLDEACALPQEVQTGLLRVLETHRLRRVGDRQERSVQLRLVLALQQPAETLVREGRWRADFWHRVNAVAFRLPPLRERSVDVPLLVNHLLQRQGRPTLPPGDIAAALTGHDWPGNVRELIRVVERADFVAGTGHVTPGTIREAVIGVDVTRTSAAGRAATASLQEMERAYIERVVRMVGSAPAAATALGLSLDQLYRRCRRFGIATPFRQRKGHLAQSQLGFRK